MTQRINPTFLLKGQDPNKLLNNYRAYKYFYTLPETVKFPKVQNNKMIAPIYGNSQKDPTYSIKDKNNNSIVIATTGHQNFELLDVNGNEQCQKQGICDFCKKDKLCIGYPVHHQEHTLLVDDIKPYYKVHYIFWCDGEICSLNCGLSEIRKLQGRDNLTKNSEELIHKLFKLMFPNSGILHPAQNPKLLKSQRGSLTEEEWNDPKYVYIETDRIILYPIKREYLQKSFLTNNMLK